MSLVVFALTVSILFGAAFADDDCSFEHLDELGSHIFLLGVEDRPIPTTPEGVTEFCKNSEMAVAEVRDFTKRCLKPFPQQLANVMLNSASNEVQSWCTADRMPEYLSHAQCMHDSQGEIDSCMRGLVMHLSDISVGAPADDRIPLACCNFAEFRECAVKAAHDHCSEDTAKFLEDLVNSYSGDVMNLACAGYESGNAACKALTFPPHDEVVPVPKTPLRPMLKMVVDMSRG